MMNVMHDRLKQFLAMENLSPARFAEVMGIQRSGISHLLAGRNKPSFEFIQRMMTAYPDLNAEWLILGKGRPFQNDVSQPEIPVQPDLFTDPMPPGTGEDPDLWSDTQIIEPKNEALQPAENRKIEPPAPHAPDTSSRKIARIIVFFSDGTYEER